MLKKVVTAGVKLLLAVVLAAYSTLLAGGLMAFNHADPSCTCLSQKITMARVLTTQFKDWGIAAFVAITIACFLLLARLKFSRKAGLAAGVGLGLALIVWYAFDSLVPLTIDKSRYLVVPIEKVVPWEVEDFTWHYVSPVFTWKFLAAAVAFLVGLLTPALALAVAGRSAPGPEETQNV